MSLDHADRQAALVVAKRAAERAGTIIASHFRSALAVEHKADESPVTRADREAEIAIRETLREAFPDDAIYGEEYGHDGQGPRLWLVDPLDGTKAFVRGYDFVSTQIALAVEDRIEVAVSMAPLRNECAHALRTGGSVVDGARAQTSSTIAIDGAHLSTGNLKSLALSPGFARLAAVIPRLGRIRGYGDYVHYHLLARGALDAVLESDVHILDVAALSLIVSEAGGVLTDLYGNTLTMQSTSVLAAATPQLHQALLSALG